MKVSNARFSHTKSQCSARRHIGNCGNDDLDRACEVDRTLFPVKPSIRGVSIPSLPVTFWCSQSEFHVFNVMACTS